MSKILVDEIAPKTSGSKVLMPQGGVIQIQYAQSTHEKERNTAAWSHLSASYEYFTDYVVDIFVYTQRMTEARGEMYMVRQADDFTITCKHKEDA